MQHQPNIIKSKIRLKSSISLVIGALLFLIIWNHSQFITKKSALESILIDHYTKKQVETIIELIIKNDVNDLNECELNKMDELKIQFHTTCRSVSRDNLGNYNYYDQNLQPVEWIQTFFISHKLTHMQTILLLDNIARKAKYGLVLSFEADCIMDDPEVYMIASILSNAGFSQNSFLSEYYHAKLLKQKKCQQKLFFFERRFDVKVHQNGYYLGTDWLKNKLIFRTEIYKIIQDHYKYRNVKSVVDFGGGLCTMAQKLANQGLNVQCYDGNPDTPSITRFGKVMDLTIPQNLNKKFDWVQSFDVGQHIPAQYTNNYIDTITKHAKYGILLSWAVPGQGKFHHENAKTNDQVIQLLSLRGFRYNSKLSSEYRERGDEWSKKSLMVFQIATDQV